MAFQRKNSLTISKGAADVPRYLGPGVARQACDVFDRLDERDREQLMVALDSLEAKLINNPRTLGESRDTPDVRVAIELPLMIEFRINETQRVVRVSGVSYIRRFS